MLEIVECKERHPAPDSLEIDCCSWQANDVIGIFLCFCERINDFDRVILILRVDTSF
jgi:hypothetical protein